MEIKTIFKLGKNAADGILIDGHGQNAAYNADKEVRFRKSFSKILSGFSINGRFVKADLTSPWESR